jgi:hypothetical protein
MKDLKKILNGAIEEAQEYITAHDEMQEVERDIEILDKAYYYIDIRFDKLEYDFQEFLNDLEITLSKDQNDEVLQVIEDTFGKYYGLLLDSEKQNQFYIPEGFAHGFYVLSETAVFTYKCTDFYDPKGEGGLMWNDPLLAVDWQSVAPGLNPLLSEKDGKHPAFDPAGKYFDLKGKWIGE